MVEGLTMGPLQLKEEVLDTGWCVSCGACVELCPYIKAVEDRVAVIHDCGLDDGNCYKVCPRTATDYDSLARAVAGTGWHGAGGDPALGGYRELCQARALEPACSGPGQYGGVVTALAALALEEKIAGAALLTASGGFFPRWTLARDQAAVIAAAGSKYAVCPGLAGLNEALRREAETEKIIVAGRPCQVTALRKMYYCSTVAGREKIGLILGLFCFWGLDYRFYHALQAEKGVHQIYRADIPKDEGLLLETDRGAVGFSLAETRSFVRQGCHSCIDPTAELADLSIGSTESDPAWCTLVVRTAAGVALVQKALARAVLETRPCPEEAARPLREAALAKKRRVLEGAAAQNGPAVNNSYIRMADATRRRIMGEGV